MALTKYRLGELIKLSDETNSENKYGLSNLKGMSVRKEFIETKADMNGVSLTPYLLVKPDYFSYVTVTSRNSEKITLAHNTTENTYIVSSSYIVFYVDKKELLLSDYLFLYFNRPEFDRYTRFNSWGSARETFSWEDMCDMEIELPPIDIQQKYVDIYNAMLANQKAYEQGLDDLKLTCDAYIENLKKQYKSVTIGAFIEKKNDRNTNNAISKVMGLSTKKEFREAQSRVNKNELSKYKIVLQNEIAYVPTTDTWKVLAFSRNDFDEPIVVSPIYEVFSVKEPLISEYLSLWLRRNEFDRYARYNSWGSARENFSFEEMRNVRIPIPDLSIQKSISNVLKVLFKRTRINEQLKSQIKDICPILIKGSLQEAIKND